jgi:hypothetical protein
MLYSFESVTSFYAITRQLTDEDIRKFFHIVKLFSFYHKIIGLSIGK